MNDQADDLLFREVHDLHSSGWMFKILQGEIKGKSSGFRGGSIWLYDNGYSIQFTKDWLMLYKKGRNLHPLLNIKGEKEMENAFDKKMEEFKDEAIRLSHRYNLTIDTAPKAIGKHPEIKTPYESAVNFIEKEAKCVYAQPNTPGKIELLGENSNKNAWNLTETLTNLTHLTELEIENKKRHQEVLEQMSQTLKLIEQSSKKPSFLQSIFKRIHIFK